MNNFLLWAAVALSVLVGYWCASYKYGAEIAELEQARSEAVAQAEKKNAEGLAKATDTINLAQAEYNDLRGELERARARLRHANSASEADSSADTLSRRVTELEGMVQKLVDSGTECGRLYQRCAANHDALAETVKP